jgi:hypothetical protein
MSQDKKGISALPLSREIGVSYPTAWLMRHKIGKAMANRDQGYPLQGRPLIDSFLGCPLLCPTGSAFGWARTTKSNRHISNATSPNSMTGSTAALWRQIGFTASCGLVSQLTLLSTRS